MKIIIPVALILVLALVLFAGRYEEGKNTLSRVASYLNFMDYLQDEIDRYVIRRCFSRIMNEKGVATELRPMGMSVMYKASRNDIKNTINSLVPLLRGKSTEERMLIYDTFSEACVREAL